MKKIIAGILLAMLILLAGCGKSGPNESALPTLESSPPTIQDTDEYMRGDSVALYNETLSSGVFFELFEDGRLVLSGGDIRESIVDTRAFKDYQDNITILEIGDGVSVVGEKSAAGASRFDYLSNHGYKR